MRWLSIHPCEIVTANQLVQNSTSKIKLLKQICKLHLNEKLMIPTIGPMCHAFGMNQAQSGGWHSMSGDIC